MEKFIKLSDNEPTKSQLLQLKMIDILDYIVPIVENVRNGLPVSEENHSKINKMWKILKIDE